MPLDLRIFQYTYQAYGAGQEKAGQASESMGQAGRQGKEAAGQVRHSFFSFTTHDPICKCLLTPLSKSQASESAGQKAGQASQWMGQAGHQGKEAAGQVCFPSLIFNFFSASVSNVALTPAIKYMLGLRRRWTKGRPSLSMDGSGWPTRQRGRWPGLLFSFPSP